MVLNDHGFTIQRLIQIFCDNISSIMLTKNQFFHMRTKHIEVHYYYVCEKDSDDMFALGVHSRKT